MKAHMEQLQAHIDIITKHYKTQLIEKNKEINSLKAENEELKHKVNLMMDCPDCKVDEYKQCLDEIEEICKNSYTTEQQYYYRTSDTILQKIKEVKAIDEEHR